MPAPLSPVVPDQIWQVSHEVRMLPGVLLPARMLVVRLDEAELALWSPVPLGEETAANIEALGEVSTIIAPNDFHHLYLGKAMDRFPGAQVWASPGLPTKRPELELEHLLGPGVDLPFAPALSPLFLEGSPSMQETVFVHRATRTLIVTDALFNLQRVRGLLSSIVLRLVGSMGGPSQTRIWRSTVKDKAAMGRSLAAVLQEDFDRIIMAHGEVIETGGREVLRAAASS